MTQAFNLSQFANKVDSTGKADLTTAVTGTLPVANGVTPFQSLLAQTALNTQGSTLDCLVSRANHTLFVVAAAGVTGGVVTLMGSMDNQNWVATSATVTTSAAGAFAASLTNTPYRYLAAKITTVISGGGAPSVTAYVGSC